MLFAEGMKGATITISSNTNWSAITPAPTSSDDIIVTNSATLTINSINAVCKSIQIASGNSVGSSGTLFFNSGSQIIVSGTVTLGDKRAGVLDMTSGGKLICQSLASSGSFGTSFIYGSGTIELTAGNTLPSSTFAAFNNLIISGGTTTSGVNLTINGNLNIGNGSTFNVGGYNLTVKGSTTVGGGTSGNLNINAYNGTKIFTGLVTINSGGKWDNSGASSPVTFQGGITNNGTFLPGNSGTQTFDTNAQFLNGNIDMSGAAVVISGINLTNNGTLTLSANFSGSGTLTNSSSGTVNSTAGITISSITNQGTFNVSSNNLTPTTFINSSTGFLNISGATYTNPNNLTNQGTINLTSTGSINTATANFTNQGTINLNGSGWVAGITNNAGGTANLINSFQSVGAVNNSTSTSVLNITALSSFEPAINNLTATVSGNIVTYSGLGDQIIKNTTYSNIVLSGSGTKTLIASATVNNSTTLNNVTFKSGAPTGFSSSLGTLLLGSSSTIALGTGSHSLTFSNSSAASWSGTLTITGWTGGYDGTSGTAGKIFFGNSSSGLTSGQLTQIQFFDGTSNFPATILNTGEVVPLASASSITTGSITGSPFCAGAAISVPFSKTGNFISGNVFTAQLSNSVGSFTSPVSIGTLTQTTSGTISGIIPVSTSAGTGYRIRVVSNSPVVTGTDNGSNLTISALPTTATNGSAQTICNSGSATLSGNNPSVGTGAWSVVSGPSTNSSQFTNASVYNTTFTPAGGAGSYVVRWTISNSPCTASYADATITVNASLSAVSITPNTAQTFCVSGSGSLLTASETGGGVITARQWGKRSTSGGAITNILGATGSTYTPAGSELEAGTWYVVCTSTPTCGSAIVSNEVLVTVNAQPLITAQPSTSPQTGCQNGTFTALFVTASGAGLTYQWYSNTNNSNSGGSSISGETSSSYTPSTTTVGTLYYYCVVSGTCGTATSNVSGAFVVNANMTVGVPSSTPTLCVNTALTPITHTTTGATGIGTPTGLPNGVSASWASNTITVSGSPTASGTFNYSIPLTGGCGSVNASGTIVVNPLPTPTLSIVSDACAQDNVIYTTEAGQNSYVWSIGGTLGVDYSIISGGGSTNNTITIKWISSGSKTVSVNYTNGNGCIGTVAQTTTTVHPLPQIGSFN